MSLAEADRLFGQREYAKALEEYRRSQEEAPVEALSQIARCLSIDSKLEEGRGWLARAETLASPAEPLGWSRFLGVRGIFEREAGDKAAAKRTFEEMHAYCVEKGLHRRAIDAVHHIAIVVPPEDQPAWALRGIAAAERLGDEGWLAVLWNNLGATYEDLKQYEPMLEAYRKAREFHHRTGGPAQKLAADWAVGHACRLLGRLDEARERLEKTLRAADTAEWVGWCKKDLGETLIAQGERTRGLALLREGRAALVESGIESWGPDILQEIDESLKARP